MVVSGLPTRRYNRAAHRDPFSRRACSPRSRPRGEQARRLNELREGLTMPSDRLQVGVIGVAGQGEYDWSEVDRGGGAIVALCDVDEHRTGKARERFPQAKFYTDFRKMFDQKGLDA